LVADDLDDMLADFRAADLANAPMVADDTTADAARAKVREETVPEATILAAIRAGDLTRLRRWHRLGVRFVEDVVCKAAVFGSTAVIRCLVEELGADVNGVNDDGVTPVSAASYNGNLNLVRFLVKTMGADVSKAEKKGQSPLFVAVSRGHLDVV
jgi:hypothetical protein